MTLTELSIKRPLLITVIFTILILFGVISYNSLNYNLLPKFEVNVVTISTVYRGASADEIESTVTKEIEDAISSMEGVDKILSTSAEGVSSVVIQLKQGISTDKAQQDAQRKVEQILNQLPQGIDRPIITKISLDELPILNMSAQADMPPTELYTLLDEQIKPLLSNVSGVGQVSLIGGEKREIKVNLNQGKLQAYKISATQVASAIAASNISFPAGNIETQQQQLSIRYDAKLKSLEALRNLIITQKPDGSKIVLSDLAEVVDAQTEPKQINHLNGVPAVGMQIMKQSDANTVEVSKGVKAKLEQIETQYASENLNFLIASDQSTYTLKSANAVMVDLLLAIAIVGLVMLFFLHSLRSSFFVLVALPSSMIPTFMFMYLFGFSLNLMTLMALSLVVGVLVDDSIVILENIYRHMEMGKDKRRAAIEGRAEIGFTAVAITLVDVVVFVPLALSGGLIGNILREFSLVVVCSTLMSLLVSFTITPLLASKFGKLDHFTRNTLWGRISLTIEEKFESFKNFYSRLLKWSLSHKRYILGGALVLFVGSLALVGTGFVGGAFMQSADRGELNVILELDPETSIYQTNQLVHQAEKTILSHPEVLTAFSNVGVSGNAMLGINSPNKAEIMVIMVDKKDREISADEFGTLIAQELSATPGLKVSVSPVGIVGGSEEAAIDIAIKGTNMDNIRKSAATIKTIVEKTPGSAYVKYNVDDPRPEVAVQLDRDRMTKLGLDASMVGMVLQNAFRGNNSAKFKSEGTEYDIMVSVDKGSKRTVQDVKDLTFVNNSGSVFRLSDFATVQETMGESILKRTDRLSSINVQSAVVGRPTGSVGGEIREEVAKLNLPDGISVEYMGQMKNQADSFGSLGLALIMAILLVYLIMVALYENVVYPLVVLFAIPLALIGALLALALTMQSLTVFSIVGIIMLIGLVTKNSILLVDFTNHEKAKGVPLVQALIRAGEERLRPILMTTLAMVFGMMPIALASGSGSEVKNGMAWAIIGGLTSSMLLTLLVVPVVYYLTDKVLLRVSRMRQFKALQRQRKDYSKSVGF